MSIFCHVKNCFADGFYCLKRNARQTIFCIIALAVGVIAGVVLFGAIYGNWWYFNRYDCVTQIVAGGFFAVFFRMSSNAILLSALLVVCSLHRAVNFVKYLISAISGLYLGVTFRIALSVFGVLGLFYGIFVFVVEHLINCIAVSLSVCAAEEECDKGAISFSEAVRLNLPSFVTLASGVAVKCIIVFVIIRLLTAFI